MYKETGKFLLHIVHQKAIWKDGELWTSLVVSLGMGVWMYLNPDVVVGISQQLGDILTVSSIVFGFIMTTLALYAELSSGWSREPGVLRVVGKIFDWQVWSVLCLIVQMAYLVALRLCDGRVNFVPHTRPVWYAILVFLTVYAGLQIWNHTLIAWWAFRDPSKLEKKEDRQDHPHEEYADHH